MLIKFNLKYPNKKFSSKKDRTILNLNIDDCAKACMDELGFDCKSFDFCYLHGDCRLSKSEVSEQEINELVESNECDIYLSKF